MRTFEAVLQVGIAFGLGCQQFCRVVQRRRQRLQRIRPFVVARQFGERGFDRVLRKRQAQVARGLGQVLRCAAQRRKITCFHRRQPLGVARQIEHLRGGQRLAEELCGGFGQLVRFVENHGVAGGQQFGDPLVFQPQIGEEQMVVDHHDFGVERGLARRHHEAMLEMAAFAAEAGLAAGDRIMPGRGVLRNAFGLGAIAAGAGFGKAGDPGQPGGIVAVSEAPVGEVALQMVMADIVGAAFQQRHPDRRFQCLARSRQVTMKQLILQGLGPGGDHHLAARQQGGNQIGQGLAGAGSGFGQQHAVVRDGALDCLGHGQLLGSRTPPRKDCGACAIGGKELFQIKHFQAMFRDGV